MNLAKQIATLAQGAGYSLPMVAEAAGYDKGTLYRWAKGTPAKMEAVEAVCQVLGLRLEVVGAPPPPPRHLRRAPQGRPLSHISEARKQMRLAAARSAAAECGA